MNIKDFLPQNIEAGEMEREVKLSRFKSPFVIKTITERENSVIRKACTKQKTGRSGKITEVFDSELYSDMLAVQTVVSPDLNNDELQTAYQTNGNAAETLKAMLRVGEYADLIQAILDFNGFNEDIDELVDEVKK